MVAKEPAIGTAEQLNHVTLFVWMCEVVALSKSVRHACATPQAPGVNLKVGSSFLGAYPAQGGAVGITRCSRPDEFDADATPDSRLAGCERSVPWRHEGVASPIPIRSVQLQDVRYRGGWAHWASRSQVTPIVG